MPETTAVKKKFSVSSRFKNLKLDNAHGLVASARKGVLPQLFYDFAETIKIPEKHLAKILHLSARTISNYKEQQKVLDPMQSEHLLKLIALYRKGEELFGSIDEFNYWLKKPLWGSKEIPMDWLVTLGGIDLLIEELDKLAQGYPV